MAETTDVVTADTAEDALRIALEESCVPEYRVLNNAVIKRVGRFWQE